MNCRKDQESKSIRKIVKKFSKVRVPNNPKFMGEVTITNLRLYKFSMNTQVDVIVNGKFMARYGHKDTWIDSSYKPKISVIKSNRLLRKLIFPHVRSHLLYFGVDLSGYWNIKKLKWE